MGIAVTLLLQVDGPDAVQYETSADFVRMQLCVGPIHESAAAAIRTLLSKIHEVLSYEGDLLGSHLSSRVLTAIILRPRAHDITAYTSSDKRGKTVLANCFHGFSDCDAATSSRSRDDFTLFGFSDRQRGRVTALLKFRSDECQPPRTRHQNIQVPYRHTTVLRRLTATHLSPRVRCLPHGRTL